jgi:endonuclease YncB( thermonuclease family)
MTGYEKSPDYGDPPPIGRWRALLSVAFVVFWIAIVAVFLNAQPASAAEAGSRMAICKGPVRITCVVDGDTFWLRGEKIRIANIDTPELGSAGCDAERSLAIQARNRLAQLLGAGSIQIIRDGTDRYGRTLAVVAVADQDVGAVLVSEQLAAIWQGRKHEWCF